MLETLGYYNLVGAVIVFLYGSLVGSFLNVVIYRLPLERSIVLPGSACGTCGTPLRWWENIPILAYFFLGGRCRVCGSSYSCRYAALEALTAFISVYLYHFYNGLNWQFFYAFVFFCLLLVVFFTDFDHWIILDSVVYTGMAFGTLFGYFVPARGDFYFFDYSLVPPFLQHYQDIGSPWLNVLSSVYGMVWGAAFYWSIQCIGRWIVKQEAMGGGDIKLAAMIGAFLGWHIGILSYFISFVLGAVMSVIMMIISKKRGRDPIPLGTFMAVSAFVCLLYSEQVVSFLMNWSMHGYSY